jgi:hypothetical protein
MSRNLGALTLLDPSGPAWPVMGVLYLYLLPISLNLLSHYDNYTYHICFAAHYPKRELILSFEILNILFD